MTTRCGKGLLESRLNLFFDVFINISVGTHPTCCNTLQHNSTHCNTLQHTATQCNTMQHTTAHQPHRRFARAGARSQHASLEQHTATHYITLQHTTRPITSPRCTRRTPLLKRTPRAYYSNTTHYSTSQHITTHQSHRHAARVGARS